MRPTCYPESRICVDLAVRGFGVLTCSRSIRSRMRPDPDGNKYFVMTRTNAPIEKGGDNKSLRRAIGNVQQSEPSRKKATLIASVCKMSVTINMFA